MTWISWTNYIETATLTASAEVAALPVDRIKIPKLSRRYRVEALSPGSTLTRVEADLGAARQCDVACWIRQRRRAAEEAITPPVFAATDTVRHTLSSDDQFTDDVYDSGHNASGVAPGYGYATAFLGGGFSSRYYAFEFDALSRDTSPENFVDWGYAWLGKIDFEPQVDFAAPAGFVFPEGATRRTSDDNSTITVRRKRNRRRFDLNFRSIRTDELPTVEAFLEHVGDGGRFLIGLDRPPDARKVMVGMLDAARYDRTSRYRAGLSLPILEAI